MNDASLTDFPKEPDSAPATPDVNEAVRILTQKLAESEAARKAAEDKAVAAEQKIAAIDANQSQASSKERWAIVIEEANSETENQEVFVQVNGRAYQIQRGLEVHVPPEVIDVLRNAVIGRSQQTYDEFGRPKGIQVRDAPRHPFRIVRKVCDKDGTPIA